MADYTKKEEGMSYDTKTIITVLALIFVFPVGLILMFVWMKWPWWVKLIIGFPVALVGLAFLGIIVVAMLATIDPSAQISKAKDAMIKNDAMEIVKATARYYSEKGTYPWGKQVNYQSDDLAKEEWLKKLVSEDEIKQVVVERLQTSNKLSVIMNEAGMQICFMENSVGKNKICVPETK